MSKFKTKYYIRFGIFGDSIEEFDPNDVMDYYDLWSDGSITIYIRKRYNFFWLKREEIFSYNDNNITIIDCETPERKYCGDKNE